MEMAPIENDPSVVRRIAWGTGLIQDPAGRRRPATGLALSGFVDSSQQPTLHAGSRCRDPELSARAICVSAHAKSARSGEDRWDSRRRTAFGSGIPYKW